jgi:hypothetical protein
MAETIAQQLMAWSLLWLGAAVVGLWRAQHPLWRAFWLMSGVWALIDALIAMGGWLGSEPSPNSLRQVLLINAGLDVLYIAVGGWLWSRETPMLKGFGLAILIQGIFLLCFDLFHALQI